MNHIKGRPQEDPSDYSNESELLSKGVVAVKESGYFKVPQMQRHVFICTFYQFLRQSVGRIFMRFQDVNNKTNKKAYPTKFILLD